MAVPLFFNTSVSVALCNASSATTFFHSALVLELFELQHLVRPQTGLPPLPTLEGWLRNAHVTNQFHGRHPCFGRVRHRPNLLDIDALAFHRPAPSLLERSAEISLASWRRVPGPLTRSVVTRSRKRCCRRLGVGHSAHIDAKT